MRWVVAGLAVRLLRGRLEQKRVPSARRPGAWCRHMWGSFSGCRRRYSVAPMRAATSIAVAHKQAPRPQRYPEHARMGTRLHTGMDVPSTIMRLGSGDGCCEGCLPGAPWGCTIRLVRDKSIYLNRQLLTEYLALRFLG